jgi:hypothetical protein
MARVSCCATSNSLHEFCAASVATRLPEAPTGRDDLFASLKSSAWQIIGKLVSLVYDRFASETTMPCTTSGPYCG